MIPRVFVITDWNRGNAEVERVARSLRPLGEDAAVIHRHKEAPARALFEEGQRLASVLQGSGVALFVNSRPDVALALGTHLQLHGEAYPAKEARALLGPSAMILVSVHRRDELAALEGADAALVAPVFAPISKRNDTRLPLGARGFSEFEAESRLPIVALGGMTPTHTQELRCRRVAACGAFFDSNEPLELAREFFKKLAPISETPAAPRALR